MQQVSLCGRLTREVEVKQDKSGRNYNKISLAVSVGKQKTAFWNLYCYGTALDNVVKYLSKGKCIIATGNMLEPSTYVSKDELKISLSMICSSISYVPYEKKEEQTKKETSQEISLSEIPF